MAGASAVAASGLLARERRKSPKAKKMAAKKAGNPTKKVSAELYGAILLYTANAIYST